MDLATEAIRKRRSVRKYEETGVGDEQLREVLEAARYAPSWANKQGWQLMVVRDAEIRNRVAEVLDKNPAARAITQAPVLLVVCMDPTASGVQKDKEYYMADAGILMDHLMLEAAEIGLGTVFIGSFDEDRIREVLGVPEEYRIVAMSPLGYPAKMPGERPRNELEDMVHWEKW
ncbi:MAG: nitroreductase family protein [Actinobacteria bacterium]|nr:nitroreductase family protein [Actinomycetota bacterium]